MKMRRLMKSPLNSFVLVCLYNNLLWLYTTLKFFCISVSWNETRPCTIKPGFTEQKRCPTLHCVSRGRLAPPLGFVTDPLLTALSPDFDPTRGLAPHPGRLGLCAQCHTADGTIHTHTLVFTAGLEALPVTVDHTIMLTACTHHIWYHRQERQTVTHCVKETNRAKCKLLEAGLTFITEMLCIEKRVKVWYCKISNSWS